MSIDEATNLISQAIKLLGKALNTLDEQSPTFPDWAEKLVINDTCLGCRKKIKLNDKSTRGNHLSCHRRTTRKIETGELTEAEAIGAGLLTPKGTKRKSQQNLASRLPIIPTKNTVKT